MAFKPVMCRILFSWDFSDSDLGPCESLCRGIEFRLLLPFALLTDFPFPPPGLMCGFFNVFLNYF